MNIIIYNYFLASSIIVTSVSSNVIKNVISSTPPHPPVTIGNAQGNHDIWPTWTSNSSSSSSPHSSSRCRWVVNKRGCGFIFLLIVPVNSGYQATSVAGPKQNRTRRKPRPSSQSSHIPSDHTSSDHVQPLIEATKETKGFPQLSSGSESELSDSSDVASGNHK